MTQTEIINELSISVACLFDDNIIEVGGNELIVASADDIAHLQNLITKLENIQDKEKEKNDNKI